ncbi:hypothetical protein Bbelb_378050 [Branchiostoma belcheri]|nr:hypothetical protein Bbelb_378050 [Branchiostoma belcheri]
MATYLLELPVLLLCGKCPRRTGPWQLVTLTLFSHSRGSADCGWRPVGGRWPRICLLLSRHSPGLFQNSDLCVSRQSTTYFTTKLHVPQHSVHILIRRSNQIKRTKAHNDTSTARFQGTFHSAILRTFHSAILRTFHSAILRTFHSAILRTFHSAILRTFHSAILQTFHTRCGRSAESRYGRCLGSALWKVRRIALWKVRRIALWKVRRIALWKVRRIALCMEGSQNRAVHGRFAESRCGRFAESRCAWKVRRIALWKVRRIALWKVPWKRAVEGTLEARCGSVVVGLRFQTLKGFEPILCVKTSAP